MKTYAMKENAMYEKDKEQEELEWEACSFAWTSHKLLMSCCGSIAYWDEPAYNGWQTFDGPETHPEQLELAERDLLVVQTFVRNALDRVRKVRRMIGEEGSL